METARRRNEDGMETEMIRHGEGDGRQETGWRGRFFVGEGTKVGDARVERRHGDLGRPATVTSQAQRSWQTGHLHMSVDSVT